MALVWIPALVRDLTDGQAQIDVPGATVRQVIDNLEARHPGIKTRLCKGDDLAPNIMVLVDGRRAALGPSHPAEAQAEVNFLPATSGG